MTLVVSVLAQDCIWQVADRRLTLVPSGRVVSCDTNKAIRFAHSTLFAYTGPARLGEMDTADWIADRLSCGSNADESLAILIDALGDAIRHVPLKARPFAVDGVGWVIDRESGELAPRLIRISNCIDRDGAWTGGLSEVRVFDGLLKPHVAMHIRVAGQPVPLDIGRKWERLIRSRIDRLAPPADTGRCLVELVRAIARGNRAVGSGVLLSTLPRTAVSNPTGFTIARMPSSAEATFKYFPEGSDEAVEKGPEVAHPGGFRVSDFRSETRPDGSQVVQACFRLGRP